MNYNIESWSIDELKEIFDIDELLNVNVIKKKVNEYIVKLQSMYSDNDKDKVIEFVNKACDKLIEYCDKDSYLLNDGIESNNDYLINKKLDNHKLETFDVEYKSGNINPLRKQIRVLNLDIDTLFRTSYNTTSSTDFVYSLPVNLKNVLSMRVASIEFPNTVYPITSKNKSNEFTIITYDIAGGVKTNIEKHKIVLPDGMYEIEYFIDYLNNTIFTSKPALERVCAVFNQNNSTINFILDTDTYDPDVNQFDLDFRIESNPKRAIQLNLGWLLGYRKPYYNYDVDYVQISNVNISNPNNGYLPEASINLFGTPYFYLHVNDFNNNFSPIYEVMFREGVITSSHILDKIPNTGQQNIIQSNISDTTKKTRYYYGPVNIQRLEIKLLDRFGKPVDIQKSDFSFTLQLEILYDI